MIGIVALWLASAEAHVPNIASYALSSQSHAWQLDVALPTDGMHQALQIQHPDVVLSELSPEAYEAQLLDALRKGVVLTFDGVPIRLGPAEMALAPHETRVRFPVAPPPPGVQNVEAHIDALHERGDQNNVFRLLVAGRQDHVVLKVENGFRGSLTVGSVEGTGVPGAGSFRSVWGWFAAGLLPVAWMGRRVVSQR